jgi:hypothetical protein
MGGSSAGSSAGHAGSSSAAGAAGAPPKPFSCPDPLPDDGVEWKLYTVQPGHCAIVGSSTWSGEQVCRETSTTDGTCDAECKNYLSVRVDLFDEPVTIAVMPLFGQVVESAALDNAACAQAPKGIVP